MASVSLNDTLDASVCSRSVVGVIHAYTLTYNKPSDNTPSSASCYSHRVLISPTEIVLDSRHSPCDAALTVLVHRITHPFATPPRLRELFNFPSFSDSLLRENLVKDLMD